MSAPEIAVRLNSLDTLKIMWQSPGYDLVYTNGTTKFKNSTLLHLAISMSHIEILKFYCEEATKEIFNTKRFVPEPIDVEVTDKKGRNILHWAAMKSNAQLVEYILCLPQMKLKIG